MKPDPRNCRLGKVDIVFREPKDRIKSSTNKTRLPKILNQKIFLPNDESIQVVPFPNTTESLIIAPAFTFGIPNLQVLWCGDRLGRPFIFGFTERLVKPGKAGDMEKFLNFIKPKRTADLQIYGDAFGTPAIYDTVWLTKIPNGYDINRGMSYFQQMIFGRMKETKGLNHLGYETFLNHTQIHAEYGIKEFKLGATWCAIANRPTIRCYNSHDVKLLEGHYFIEPSRFQVYLPRKLNGR